MPTLRRRRSKSVATKSAELAVAAPQVIAHRMARLAVAGRTPTARDRREFQTMISEKQSAFAEAWFGMTAETVRVNQAFAAAFFSNASKGRPPFHPWFGANSRALQNAAGAVADKGLGPFHRKATANAKRLAKTKRR